MCKKLVTIRGVKKERNVNTGLTYIEPGSDGHWDRSIRGHKKTFLSRF